MVTNGKQVTDRTIISQNLVEVSMKKTHSTIKSPRYLAQSLLWLSKIKMLDFYYNILLRVHPCAVEMYATDTDSIKFECTGFHGVTMKDRYDAFLNMFEQHTIKDVNGTNYNLLQLGFQKDGEIIPGNMKMEELFTEAVYLKPKLYAQHNVQVQGQDVQHAKGVELYQNPTLAKITTYRTVLQDETVMFTTNMNIQKTKKLGSIHNVTLTQTKIAMDSFDDKRRWLAHNRSEPYGMRTPERRPIQERIKRNLIARIRKYVEVPDELVILYLGCSVRELMNHLESKWSKCDVNVCWKNYGIRWQIDHIAPVSVLKHDHSEATLKKICNYNNLQPLSCSQNASKKDDITNEAKEYLARWKT